MSISQVRATPLRAWLDERFIMSVGLAIAALSVGAANAAELGPIVQITGKSPFKECTADKASQQDGTYYPKAAVEPWVAADLNDPSKLIVGWQQDRWSNGGSRGDVAAVSNDGGATWTTVVPGPVTKCEGGRFARASDPWVDFSPSGAAFFMHLAVQPDLPNGSLGRNAMIVARSLDGGQTWPKKSTLINDEAGQVLNDKNSLTADPTTPDNVYAVWDRMQDFTLPPAGAAEASSSSSILVKPTFRDGVLMARQRVRQLRELAARNAPPVEVQFVGPTYLARTTNGGNSWHPAELIFDPGPNAHTINNTIVVPPSGTVINFFTHVYANGGTRIELIRSSDKGATFGEPILASTMAKLDGAVTPDTQELVRDGSILFDVAVDPENGNLYLVWQDIRFSGVDQVAFSMSTNGGTRWSNPVRINKTPPNPNLLREQAFIPSIEVGPGGVLVATYYDFRNDDDKSGETTDYWVVFCDPQKVDCRKAANWGDELRLTDNSFDMLHAPLAGGLFLGDYMGLVRAGKVVHPVFGIATKQDHAVLLTRKILFPDQLAAKKR